MNNVIKLKNTYEEVEYEGTGYGEMCIFGNGDVGVSKDEDGFNLKVDFGIFKNIDELKEWCIESFVECKDYLEQEYGMVDTTKYIYRASVGYEIEHMEDAEMFGINFDIPDINTINEIYIWICKAIKTIHNL